MSETFAFCAVLASALLWAATAVAWAARQGAFAEAWRGWADGSRLRKALSLVALAALVSWAGTKPEGKGEIIELSNNRIIESVDGSALSSVGRDVLDAPQSVGRDDPIAPKSVGRDVLGAPQDGISHGAAAAASHSRSTDAADTPCL